MEKDASEEVRFAAAISLLRLGTKSPEEARDLVQRLNSTWVMSWAVLAYECTLALTQVQESGGFDKLMREFELKRPIDSPSSLAAALGDAGLKLANADELNLRGAMGAGRLIRPLDLIESMSANVTGVIVENEALRIVPRDVAMEYWQKRLERK